MMASRSGVKLDIVLKATNHNFSKKSLDPITEENQDSTSEIRKSATKRQSLRLEPSGSYPSGIRMSKVCPLTKTECPSLPGERKFRRSSVPSLNDDSYSLYSDMSEISVLTSQRNYGSLLDKPFMFRNADSLQRAVDTQAMMLKRYLERMASENVEEEQVPTPGPCSIVGSSESTVERITTFDSKSQTDSIESRSYASTENRKLNYLLGISAEKGEEEGEATEDIDGVILEEPFEKCLTGETQAMKQAQRYLRVHRIFEFYQFLVAHLLSSLPENPINFILALLDRCIIYRAGIGIPPVLYDRKHLEALFNLMDRMRTGYIDKNQYATGMKTLGICSYNPNPPTMDGDMVHKSFFIEEAYDNLVSMLNDVIRRRWIYFNQQPMPITTPPPTPQFSTRSGKTNTSSRKN